jgi:hypothetical protein
MDTDIPTTQQDKQVTIPIPEDRLAEFYAFYARFLAADRPGGRRGRRRGPHGHGPGHHGHGCRKHRDDGETNAAATAGGHTPPAPPAPQQDPAA